MTTKYNIEELKIILDPFIDSNLCTQIFNPELDKNTLAMLQWDELSSIEENYPFEYLGKFRDYWNYSKLINNRFIYWTISHLFLLDNNTLLKMINKENVDLKGILHILNLSFRNNLDQKNKILLSQNKDLTVDLVSNYYNLFEFGKDIKYTSVFSEYHMRGATEYNLIPNLFTNKNFSFDIKFIHDYREYIDFWYLSLYSKIDITIIDSFQSHFDCFRPYMAMGYKYSDYGYYQKYYITSGWENLFINPNINIDELINKFGDKLVRTIEKFDSDNIDESHLNEEYFIENLKTRNLKRNSNNWIKLKDLRPDVEKLNEMRVKLKVI